MTSSALHEKVYSLVACQSTDDSKEIQICIVRMILWQGNTDLQYLGPALQITIRTNQVCMTSTKIEKCECTFTITYIAHKRTTVHV